MHFPAYKKRLMKKIHLYFAVFFAISCFSQSQNYYQIGNGQTVIIDEWNECRSVVNSTGAAIFVPTKTSAEWTSFRNNSPSGITLNACTFSCGSVLVDSRDGQSYNTVQIGNQCWMAENLNYGEMIMETSLPSNNNIAEKYCFDNSLSNCNQYGGLYTSQEVVQYTQSQGGQGLCPQGWHVPTEAEWCTMMTSLDQSVTCNVGSSGLLIYDLLSVGGSSGFEAVIAGRRLCTYGGKTQDFGDWGGFHSSTYYGNNSSGDPMNYDFVFSASSEVIYKGFSSGNCYGLSVRCVKD